MNNADIKAEIARVVALLSRGAEALLTFQSPAGILRDTSTASAGILGRTSSHRTFEALAEARRVLRDEGSAYAETCLRLADALAELWSVQYVPKLTQTVEDTHAYDLRNSSGNSVNMFTDAHLACSLAYVGTSLLNPIDATDLEQAKALRLELASEASDRLAQDGIGKVSDNDPGHDFVTLWAVRAVDAVGHRDALPEPAWGASVGKRVRNNILQQLGWHSAGVGARFDPGELAFALPLLQRFAPDEARPLAARCIEVMAEAQTADGAWPSSRIVSPGEGSLLHITSYEVALTLATWLDQRDALGPGDDSNSAVSARTLDVLRRAFRLAETSYTDEEWERSDDLKDSKTSPRRGWSNDRTRGQGRVESWVTAVVVTFLARYHDVLTAQLQRQILERYETRLPHQQGRASPYRPPWPDFVRSFGPSAPFPDSSALLTARISDPSELGDVGDSLAFNIVEPVLLSSNLRPRENSLSFVLPGPPGSRKTSLVASVAAALQWPLVTVSPPTFLMEGLDGLERRAAQVFEDLTSLRRTVILFDECEELFRDRQSEDNGQASKSFNSQGLRPSAATRTAGAFITTGMLPRLQALHDRAWSVFALAFNGSITDLDAAAVRPGRFDFTLVLEYPTLEAQVRYVKQQVGEASPPLISALRVRAETELREHRDASMQWAVLNEVIAYFKANPNVDATQLNKAIYAFSVVRPPDLPRRLSGSL